MMKQKLSTIFGALLAVAAQAQTTLTVRGTAPAGTSTVYLLDVARRFAPIDSASVADGKFTLSSSQPENAVLGVGSREFALLFFNDGTPVTVALETQTLRGSAQNERLNVYDRELSAFDNQIADLVMWSRSNPNATDVQMDSIVRTYNALVTAKEALQKEIVRDNADNLIPVAFISDMAYGMDYDELKELCQPGRAYSNHPVMDLPRRLLANMEKRAPGKMFTDMTIADMDGRERKLSEWIGRGQYVMVDFWASWCGPCRQEMPNVVENYNKYHAKGFEIIGISFDRTAEPWKKAVEQMQMTWPQLSDLGYWQSAAVGVYGINSIPASILFGPDGKIVATDLRGEKLGQKLHEIYGGGD